MHWLISIEEEPNHDSKLFTRSLNDNKAKSRVIKITLVCVDVIYSHSRISVNCLNQFDWVSLTKMEIGLKHVLVIPSSLTLAGFAKPLVEPCCLRVEQALLQWHGSDSYTSKGYKNEIRKAKYPIDNRNYGLLVFILRLPRYSLTFSFPLTRPSVHSPVYQRNNCTSNITRILSTILAILTSIRRGLLTCASHFLLHTRFLRWGVICKLAIKWYLMRMCTSWLCPFNAVIRLCISARCI